MITCRGWRTWSPRVANCSMFCSIWANTVLRSSSAFFRSEMSREIERTVVFPCRGKWSELISTGTRFPSFVTCSLS